MKNKSFSERYDLRWVILISFWTFIMSGVFSMISERLVQNLNLFFGFLILIFIIFIGIIFDIIGVAVTTAEEKPFHAMAANRISEGKYAIKLVRNASQVSNFCNDVIGDISGIISGAIATNIIFNIMKLNPSLNGTVLSLLLTSFVASLTVGGKAFGKRFAMLYNSRIIFLIAKILYFLDDKLKIKVIKK